MKSPSFRFYIIVSFFIHILVGGGFLFVQKLTPPAPINETVDIHFLTTEDIQKMAQLEKALQQKKIYAPNSQIVEQNDSSTAAEAPENARFLSAKNQKVEKETIAAQRGEFQNIKKAATAKAGQKGTGADKSAKLSEETKKQIAKDLFKGFDASEALERQKIADSGTGSGSEKGTGSGAENANDKGADSSQSNDYIKGVEVGLETVLNTREFKYYSYYNRIRKQLSQHWEGRVREKLSKLFKEGRAPAATNQDRITKLMITLNDRGTLVRVQVLSDSGVQDLDEAAIEAFRAAAPFPNPPKGIIEGDGTVKIRWDFVLET